MDWKDKVCILTGATSGIGREAAFDIARKGLHLVLPVRNMKKAAALKNEIAKQTGNQQVHLYECDLASMDSIRQFCDAFLQKHNHLHILINNAGTWETRRKESADGIELTLAVNHLAPFLMTNLLLKRMKNSTPARIINVSSKAHIRGNLNFQDLEGKNSWSSFGAYANSKLANILFTRELARQLNENGITANCLHPGVVDTRLYHKMPAFLTSFFRLFMISPSKGSETIVHLALSPEVQQANGEYFYKKKVRKPARQALDDTAARRLWEVSCEYTGIQENMTGHEKTA